MFKILIVAMGLVILVSLGTSLSYLVRDRGQTERTVKALTWRIGLSLGLFILLIIGFSTGMIVPHGL